MNEAENRPRPAPARPVIDIAPRPAPSMTAREGATRMPVRPMPASAAMQDNTPSEAQKQVPAAVIEKGSSEPAVQPSAPLAPRPSVAPHPASAIPAWIVVTTILIMIALSGLAIMAYIST